MMFSHIKTDGRKTEVVRCVRVKLHCQVLPPTGIVAIDKNVLIATEKYRGNRFVVNKRDTVGAPLAAFAARNNRIFDMSHKTVPLPIAQAKARGKAFTCIHNETRHTVMATIYDYVFRTRRDPSVDNMNYWTFVATQETCKLKKTKNLNHKDLDESSEESSESKSEMNHAGKIFHFEQGHPRSKQTCHRYRKVER